MSFVNLFVKQKIFQSKLVAKGVYEDQGLSKGEVKLPADLPKICSYQVQQLISEIGEVLEADKRWKSYRNGRYDRAGKLDEIADCFIVLMNITMFSGFSANDILNAVESKIATNNERIDKI